MLSFHSNVSQLQIVVGDAELWVGTRDAWLVADYWPGGLGRGREEAGDWP